ncbi:Cytochrome c-552 precursor [compost metagenome]
MNKSLVISAVALFACASAHADPMLDLAKEKQCMSCHSVDATLLAPSFSSIAKRYQSQASAQGMLVSTVMKGTPESGGYHWGTMQMPGAGARASVTESEAAQLVQWILNLK